MKIGIPKEIISQEYRVSVNPETAKMLLQSSHELYIQSSAGVDSGYSDDDYSALGCSIVDSAAEVFDKSDLIIKVKEPSLDEVEMLSNKVIFTYLHLSSSKELTQKLLDCNVTGLAYETVVINNETPMLKPMSEIAGRLSLLDSIELLKKSKGGKGKLIAGTSLAEPANVLIIGGGIVGLNAMQMSLGLGASTTLLDVNNDLLSEIKAKYPAVNVAKSSKEVIENILPMIDIVVGAVLTPGGKPPTVITRDMLSLMEPKTILSDVSVDQGGCFETSKPTTHGDPTYEVDNIIHYCVKNIPSAVPFTATNSLNEATKPFIHKFANIGLDGLLNDERLLMALNTYNGKLTNKEVSIAHSLEYSEPKSL
jgi:alanine dehydrogenase